MELVELCITLSSDRQKKTPDINLGLFNWLSLLLFHIMDTFIVTNNKT